MRPLVLLLVVVLAGCANPEMEKLKTACQGGNLQACATVEQREMMALMMLQQWGANMSAAGRPTYTPPPAPAPTFQTTNCFPTPYGVRCNTF